MIHIRSETISDYHRIAEINALAFSAYLKEPLTSTFVSEFRLVDALRSGARFDPDLSLVAEVNDIVVGHALFYPYRVFVAGEEMPAVSLAPIAVDPAFQGQGIGGRLIREGHRRAKAKGYVYSFLLGHPTYYPRFGYQTNMFGACHLEIRAEDVPHAGPELSRRQVRLDDLDWLADLWLEWFADVDLAAFPGDSILDWLTQTSAIMSVVVERDGEPLGYLRYSRHDPAQVYLFLARSRAAVRSLLAYLWTKGEANVMQRIKLPLHPGSKAVREQLDIPYKPETETWAAAMIKILDEDNPLIAEYCQQVGSGQRKPGLVIWPPSIEPT
jgi:predicted N-acetyltransferase YhbS